MLLGYGQGTGKASRGTVPASQYRIARPVTPYLCIGVRRSLHLTLPTGLGVGANTLCQPPDTRCRVSTFLVVQLGILIQPRRPRNRRLVSGRVVEVIDMLVVVGDVLFHHAL